jgi:aspartyl-tRNA(Asn)/glutamyl-tRNA(Gln) amidotransferase subunit B
MNQPAPYRTVIGLEVHVQLLTRTKLFCGCSTTFGLPPNSATCPVCIGMPGVLPMMNRKAFDLALKAALALNCQIAPFTKWDRKNYYYPDLPKNYQISQYDLPFSHDGWLEIQTGDRGDGEKARRIGIIRVHLEEDAGKSLHDETGGGGHSRVDLNRAGTPLLEIVSRPDIASPEEARAYLEEIRLLLRELEVSDCEMQEGSLRCDANVNIHVPQPDGSFAATPIVEVKNLNSIRGVERAMKYEAQRQFEEVQNKLGGEWQIFLHETKHFGGDRICHIRERRNGELVELAKATAGWDDRHEVTQVQRRKEEASDYRYFPEPDLVPVTVSTATLDAIRDSLGELPAAQRARLQTQYGLSAYDAGVLSRQGRAFVAYYEETVQKCGDAKEASNWITNEVLQALNESKRMIKEFPVSAAALADLIKEIKSTGLNKQRSREVFGEMLGSGGSAKQAMDKLGFKVVADEGQLRELVRKAVAANAKAVADFKKGKTKAADAIKGAVMRETKGMAKTELVQQILLDELSNLP